MVEQAVSKEDVDFMSVFENKLAFSEIFLSNRKPIKLRQFQKDILLDPNPNVVCESARDIGKTLSLEADVIWTATHTRNKEGMILTPGQAHLDPLWDRLIMRFESDPFLDSFLVRRNRAPLYLMEFVTGFILYGRIAGPSSGNTVLSLHLDFIWSDESQLLIGMIIDQLQGCMNKGCIVKLFGVPNGIRKSYLYRAGHEFDFKTYTLPKWVNPEFTQKEYNDKAKKMGGESSQVFQNQILAKWGMPQRQTFPEKDWGKCLYKSEDYTISIIDIIEKVKLESIDLLEKPSGSEVVISADIAYLPDPTVIGIHGLKDGIFTLFNKVIVRGIPHHIQARLFDELARYYDALCISMDATGAGQPLSLMLEDDIAYPNKPYKVVAVKFSGTVEVGRDKEDKPIKSRIKFFSTVLLQQAFEKKGFLIPDSDYELIAELQESTQSRAKDGTYEYHESQGHNLQMLRCAVVHSFVEAKEAKSKGQSKVVFDSIAF